MTHQAAEQHQENMNEDVRSSSSNNNNGQVIEIIGLELLDQHKPVDDDSDAFYVELNDVHDDNDDDDSTRDSLEMARRAGRIRHKARRNSIDDSYCNDSVELCKKRLHTRVSRVTTAHLNLKEHNGNSPIVNLKEHGNSPVGSTDVQGLIPVCFGNSAA